MRRQIFCVWLVLLLAGCAAAPTTEAPAQVTSTQPSVTPEERASATAASEAGAVAQTTDAPAEPDALPTEVVLTLFHGVSHGVTEDGFPFLGEADAPVTLIDYSDFL